MLTPTRPTVKDVKKQSTLLSSWTKKRKRSKDSSGTEEPEVVNEAVECPIVHTFTPPDLTVLSNRVDFEGSPFLGEGRVLTLEFTTFYLVNAYVPNSGQNLERLKSRTEQW
jgi:hypothetical protein